MKRFLLTVAVLLAAACASPGFEGPLSALNAQSGATPGGNYVADALRYTARAEAAFVISSDLRDFTSSKEPTAEELVSLIAIKSDKVYTLRITGSAIKQAVEKACFLYPRANPAFLHYSGIRVTLKGRTPVSVEILGPEGNYEPVADGVIYSVAMSQSLAEGVLGYWRFWDIRDAEEEDQTMGDIIPLYFAEEAQRDPFEARLTEEE